MSGRQEDLKLLNAHFHFLVRVLDGAGSFTRMGIYSWDIEAGFGTPPLVRTPRLTIRCEYPDDDVAPQSSRSAYRRPTAFSQPVKRTSGSS